MNYYWIKEHETSRNIIQPQLPGTSQIWAEKKPLLIKGSVVGVNENIRFLSFYQAVAMSKAFLITTCLWNIWNEAQRVGRFRPCAFGYIPKRDIRPYMLIMPTILEALHEDTEYFKNGDIRRICLKNSKIGSYKVFAVRGEVQISVIVAEDVLEETFRNGITDFRYEQIDRKE